MITLRDSYQREKTGMINYPRNFYFIYHQNPSIMRTFKLICNPGLAFMFILFLNCCTKENAAPIERTATTGPSENDMVLTPAGLMEKSKVHFIAEGFSLNVENGRLQKIDSRTGKMVEDFG